MNWKKLMFKLWNTTRIPTKIEITFEYITNSGKGLFTDTFEVELKEPYKYMHRQYAYFRMCKKIAEDYTKHNQNKIVQALKKAQKNQ